MTAARMRERAQKNPATGPSAKVNLNARVAALKQAAKNSPAELAKVMGG